MEDSNLILEVEKAARDFSARENTDVDVRANDGSARVFSRGEEIERTGSHWDAARPSREHGQPQAYADGTPHEVRLGKWDGEDQDFHSSGEPMSAGRFLELCKKRKAHYG